MTLMIAKFSSPLTADTSEATVYCEALYHALYRPGHVILQPTTPTNWTGRSMRALLPFLQAVETKGFSAASRLLGINQEVVTYLAIK